MNSIREKTIERKAKNIARENIREAFITLYTSYTSEIEDMIRNVRLNDPESPVYEGCVMGMRHSLEEFKKAYQNAFLRKM